MESAGALAKEVGNWNEVSDFYRRASELYIECGRAQPASDALAKGARYLIQSHYFLIAIGSIFLVLPILLLSRDL